MQDGTAMNGVSYFFYFFPFLFVNLRIEISDLSEMTSFYTNRNEAVLLFSRLVIVAGLFIVCSCKKIVTQRPLWA